jgi:hypothetical protein
MSRLPYAYDAEGYDALTALLRPTTETSWKARYEWLFDRILQAPYRPADLKALHMFRALDSDGNEMDVSRPVCGAVGFVARVGGRALAGEQVLNADETLPPQRRRQAAELGQRIWRRSRWGSRAGTLGLNCAGAGDGFLEAVRLSGSPPYRSAIVVRDPRNVSLVYDAAGLEIERAIIEVKTFEPNSQTLQATTDSPLHVYKRILTKNRIEVYRDGKLVVDESGDHGLGVVPLVHVPFLTIGSEYEHGYGAAHGLEWAAAIVDSGWGQSKAIAVRYANPTHVFSGVRVNDDSYGRFGRSLAMPQGARAEVLEASLSQIGPILDTIKQVMEGKSYEYPEYLFASAGANASGEALRMLGTAYVNKYKGIRAALYREIARATEMAAMLDLDRPYEEIGLYEVTADPLLPTDVPSKVAVLVQAADYLKPEDITRELQALGVGVPAGADPAEYAAELAASQVPTTDPDTLEEIAEEARDALTSTDPDAMRVALREIAGLAAGELPELPEDDDPTEEV